MDRRFLFFSKAAALCIVSNLMHFLVSAVSPTIEDGVTTANPSSIKNKTTTTNERDAVAFDIAKNNAALHSAIDEGNWEATTKLINWYIERGLENTPLQELNSFLHEKYFGNGDGGSDDEGSNDEGSDDEGSNDITTPSPPENLEKYETEALKLCYLIAKKKNSSLISVTDKGCSGLSALIGLVEGYCYSCCWDTDLVSDEGIKETKKHLQLAIQKNNQDLVDFLIQNNICPPQEYMELSIETGNCDAVKRLLGSDKRSECNIDRCFELAIRRDKVDIADAFVEWVKPTKEHLQLAIKHNSVNIVDFLIRKDACSVKDSIELSIEMGRCDIVKHLLDSNDCPASDIHHYFDLAIQLDKVDIASLLVNKVGTPTKEHLQLAIQHNSVNIIDFLIEKGVYFEGFVIKDSIEMGKSDVARHLINSKTRSVSDLNCYLNLVIQFDKTDIVNFLINKGASITNEHLLLAIQYNSINFIDFLAEKNIHARCHIDLAFQEKKYNVAKHLINATLCSFDDIVHYLDVATPLNVTDIVDSLVAKGRDVVQKDGSTLLHYAILNNRVDIINSWIKQNLAVSADQKNSVSYLAVLFNNQSIITFLNGNKQITSLEFAKRVIDSLPPQDVDHYFSLAFQHDRADIAALLIAKGAKVETKFADGSTMLHKAVLEKRVNMVALLLDKNIVKEGIDVNAAQNNGASPLYLAVSLGNEPIVKTLIKNGANVKQNCVGLLTPLRLALSTDNGSEVTEIAELLMPLNMPAVNPQIEMANAKKDAKEGVLRPLYDVNHFTERDKETKKLKHERDPGDYAKRKALGNPSQENIMALFNSCRSSNYKNYSASHMQALEILCDDGNPCARRWMDRLKHNYGGGSRHAKQSIPNVLEAPICSSLQEYEDHEQKIDEYNRSLDEKLFEVMKKYLFPPCGTYVDFNGITRTKYFIYDQRNVVQNLDMEIEERDLEPPNIKERVRLKEVRFPISWDLLGLRSNTGYNFDGEHKDLNNYFGAKTGWKLHISAKPSSAADVAGIVIPFCEKYRLHYKLFATTPQLREQFANDRYLHGFSQRGKFIVIYPTSDEESRWIATYIDREFNRVGLTRNNFFYVFGDFAVGNTGGIYTRLCAYNGKIDKKTIEDRGMPCINEEVFQYYASENNHYIKDCVHPFRDLGLWDYSKNLSNKTIVEITNEIYFNYNYPLIMHYN